MSGFDDLIPAAMPYLATEDIQGSAGSTWEWSYDLQDNGSVAVDLTTGFTGVCEIRTKPGAPVLIAPTVSFPAAGKVKVTATAAQTASLKPGIYRHEVEVTRTSDGKKVKLVGAGAAKFEVLGEVTA